jgi:hypothetical protein
MRFMPVRYQCLLPNANAASFTHFETFTVDSVFIVLCNANALRSDMMHQLYISSINRINVMKWY